MNSSLVFSEFTFSSVKFAIPVPSTIPPTEEPSKAPSAVVPMSNAEMSVIIVGAFLGLVIFGLIAFAALKYFQLMYTRYHQKKYLREGVDIVFSSETAGKDDLNLDKLDYIADVMQSRM